jgi:translocation and assembly module TamA
VVREVSSVAKISSLFPWVALWLCLAVPLRAAEPVEVEVEGVEGDVLANVRQALALPPGLVRDGKVDRDWLERFARQAQGRVLNAMEPFGYYSARVTTAIEATGGEGFRLRVKVEPGEPVRVGEILVEVTGPGQGEGRLRELATAFPLRKGGVLLQQKYEEAKAALKSRAEELGYLDADFSAHEIRIDAGAATARIALTLDTGRRYSFDGVKIEGAPDYPDEFLRRFLAFKPGEVFSQAKLGETQLNFTNSERFREVIVTPERQEARDGKVPLTVRLKPEPRRLLRPGIGYGTDTGARFMVRYRDLNIFRVGHELDTTLYVAERLQGLAAGYTLPDPLDMKSSTKVQLNLQREDVTTYVSRLAAVELDRNRSLGKGMLGTAYVKLQYEDFTVGTQESTARLVLPGARLTVDRYDNPIRPTRGYRYGLDVRGTHEYLGSDTGLLQVIAEGGDMVPLPWRLSLHTRARTGITVLSNPLQDLPPSLRFFAGGDQSVRGYSYQSLGPKDATGRVVGGRHLVTASAELERALFTQWGVSAFYDAGNAFNSFTSARIFQGAGVGLHYYTPVGGLNIYLARQVGVINPGFHVHFTMGFEL